MPIVSSKDATILVTGSNGFIGMWIVDTLLKRGYTVRAAVRTENRGQHLLKTFKSCGQRLHIFPIGDISADGAFDEAVKGVEGIIHAAAHVTVELDHLEATEVINAAVQGNINILNSAKKFGTNLKRVVITSSCASRTDYSPVPKHVDDNTWNDESVAECERLGKAANGLAKYQASKTVAERVAWAWYEKEKPALSWDLTSLNPPWVFGPVLQEVSTIDTINASNLFFYNVVVKGDLMGQSPLTAPSHGWVDARDVAELHVRSLEVPEASDEKFLVVSGQFVWQDALDAANSVVPSPWPSHTEPLTKGENGERVYNLVWDVSKQEKICGLKYRTLKETARDILADYERLGWK